MSAKKKHITNKARMGSRSKDAAAPVKKPKTKKWEEPLQLNPDYSPFIPVYKQTNCGRLVMKERV
jgi:hypothetical protein